MRRSSIKIFLFFVVLFHGFLSAQNRPLLYGFGETPNSLLLNPGAVVNSKYHIGIPVLSNISAHAGITGATLVDLFKDDGIPFNTKFERVSNQWSNSSFLSIHAQTTLLDGGYRLSPKAYLSFGMYQEIDAVVYYPKNMMELLYYGNEPFLNKSIYFSELKFRGEVLGVLHAGLSYKRTEKLHVGGRLKLYSGALHVASNNNSGTFNTELGDENLYRHVLRDVGIAVNSSGFYKAADTIDVQLKDVLGNTVLSKNIGVGIDIGFTYQHTPQIKFSGSILDIGFVSYSKNTKNLVISGAYQFEGVEPRYDENNIDYLAELDRDFRANVPRGTNTNSYIAWRPFKFNAAVAYSFGENNNFRACTETPNEGTYSSAIGLHLFAVTRPLRTQLATSVFVERRIGQHLQVKMSYTADDFSTSNIGMGLVMKFGGVQMYGMFGNVLKFSELAGAQTAALDFGVNLIFD